MRSLPALFKITAALLLSLLFQAQSCQEEMEAGVNDSGIVQNELSPEVFQQLLEIDKGLLIDLRTASEYDTAHIPGAVNIDIMSDDFKPAINRLDKKTTYFIYCTSGGASKVAAEYMALTGLRKIYILKGGINAWKAAKNRIVPEERKLEDSL